MIMNRNAVPILLVDDSQVDIDLALMAFSRIKLENPIQIARDGAETLEIVHSWKSQADMPHLILLDIKLPKVSGLEVLKELKQSEKTSHIPVVMLTSSTNDADVKTAYQTGANSYIIKPVDFDKFISLTSILCEYWINLNVKPEEK